MSTPINRFAKRTARPKRRRPRIFTRIIVPAIAALVLLPPLACLVFNACAQQYALNSAAKDLSSLQAQITPLLDEYFPQSSNATNADGIGNPKPAKGDDPVNLFLEAAGVTASQMGGNARLMILTSQMQVVYPRNDQLRQDVEPLAEDFAAYIQHNGTTETAPGETITLEASEGETYLANIYEVPIQSQRIRYVITYCPMSDIGAWVGKASLLVLAIASVFALLAFCALWYVARSITRPLQHLCSEANRIGAGGFDAIEPAFNLQELEDLRGAMNNMSAQLERSEQAQQRFFQNASHELRSPLMSIIGYAQGIEQGIFQPPQGAARIIMDEGERLTHAVSELLALSRLEGGQPQTKLVPLPLADMATDCLERIKGQANSKGISLVKDIPDNGITAYGTEELVASVLDNLLSNAIRYAHASVQVRVRQGSGNVTVSIADDGDGISDEDLPHVFERCYKGADGQFGIGLAIAASAAKQMQGQLKAENCPEGGAIFTLRLRNAAC